jgi:hypothetical protein
MPLDSYFHEADIPDLIERCIAGGSESDFAKFRSAWHPHLEAALALVDPDWILTQKLYDQIYDAYFETFRRPKKTFQVNRHVYLLAVAYSYVIQQSGDEPLQQLLTHLLGSNQPLGISQHELYILVFCAILRSPGLCISPLLGACFPQPSFQWALQESPMMSQTRALRPVPPPCLGHMKSTLWMALR